MKNPMTALIDKMSPKPTPEMSAASLPKIDVSTRADVKLGQTVKEKITGFTGVVVCISHHMDGSVMVGVQPRKLEDSGKPAEPYEFDIERIAVVDTEDVILNSGGSKEVISLGAQYRDEVTGMVGTATSYCEFIGGCRRVTLCPKVDKAGKVQDSRMCALEQVTLLDEVPAKKTAERRTPTGGPGTSEKAMMARLTR